jgi:GMP synthase (glutamine-hydrolysing)
MKVLVFQHVDRENPAYIADYAKEKNIALDVIELWDENYAIPSAEGYDAVIILGGPMGVYEEFPSKNDELTFIEKNIGKVRMLGVCLGSQLIAHALGGKVWNEPRQKEIGYYDITLTEKGKKNRLFAGFESPFKALEWHGDVFDVPPGAELLACGSPCACQAFSTENAYGLLFHVELTPERIRECLTNDREWINRKFEFDEKKFLEATDRHAPLMKRQCFRLLDNFLA